jgi:C-terminal processing protease CtpA/Prc
MLSGLKPLLGAGNFGSFRDRQGRDSPWDPSKLDGCSAPIPHDVRVAVLIGPKTASSGEAVVVAFSGMPNARSFGGETSGLSTSNRTFRLPDGGALFLTNAIDVDRTGKEFPQGITPDVVVEQEGTDDDTLAAAQAWLEAP